MIFFVFYHLIRKMSSPIIYFGHERHFAFPDLGRRYRPICLPNITELAENEAAWQPERCHLADGALPAVSNSAALENHKREFSELLVPSSACWLMEYTAQA